jgi:hypothetical protein
VGEDASDHRLILTIGRDDLTARNAASKTSERIGLTNQGNGDVALMRA